MYRFSGHLYQQGNNTGIEVPAEIVAALGSKRAAVKVNVNGYTFRGTIAAMSGKYLISFSSEKRAESGLKGGDAIDVTLELDTNPRAVELPVDLASALDAIPAAKQAFEALPPSHRKAHVTAVESAKTAETRQRRIEKMLATLTGSDSARG